MGLYRSFKKRQGLLSEAVGLGLAISLSDLKSGQYNLTILINSELRGCCYKDGIMRM